MKEGKRKEVIKKLLNYKKETKRNYIKHLSIRRLTEEEGWADFELVKEILNNHHYRDIREDVLLKDILLIEKSICFDERNRESSRRVYKFRTNKETFLKIYVYAYENNMLDHFLNSDYLKDNFSIFKTFLYDYYKLIHFDKKDYDKINIKLFSDYINEEKVYGKIKIFSENINLADTLLFYYYAKNKNQFKKTYSEMINLCLENNMSRSSARRYIIDSLNFSQFFKNEYERIKFKNKNDLITKEKLQTGGKK